MVSPDLGKGSFDTVYTVYAVVGQYCPLSSVSPRKGCVLHRSLFRNSEPGTLVTLKTLGESERVISLRETALDKAYSECVGEYFTGCGSVLLTG
jgi:hypothetical protein